MPFFDEQVMNKWWTSDEQVIQVAKFPMTMCDLCENSADVASWSRSSGWHWLEHFPHQFPWSGLSVPGQRHASFLVEGQVFGKVPSIPIHCWGCRWHWCWFLWTICWSNRKGTAGAIWRMRNCETCWNSRNYLIFWMFLRQRFSEISMSQSWSQAFLTVFLRSFAIGVLLSQLSASGGFWSFEILMLRWIVLF